ncbi:MAG TPA: amidohydrolase family protein [Spirochaetota bacterium]|nr:amidohydrolase family protein [Spirochaetota bacterium]HOM38983.1 amidohydrolase family protein [Spirochaetota bacterium]HPQ48357.1 amidohydrolase family protein [Spirochaetota bacterium]
MKYFLDNIYKVESTSQGKGIIGVNENIISYKMDKDTKVFELGSDYFLYPGFVNSHDHMLGTYFPRVGKGPYINWLPWDNDLKDAMIYKERGTFTNYELYFLSSIRNIISGVTWVSDHIPHSVNEKFIGHLPINIIKDYTLAHEVSSYDLKWGDPATEHEKAKKNKIPFITHIEEGFDQESEKGVEYLKEFNALDEYTVMVHGIALSDKDIEDIAKSKAHLVWCPTSNWFMFEKTADIKKWLSNNINVCLGTDSPMSGGMNLLEEINFASYIYNKLYDQKLDPRIVFNMITVNPAKAFRIPAGNLKEGTPANFVITKKVKNDPYENILCLKLSDISLVVINGKPVYGDIRFKNIIEYLKIQYMELKIECENKFLAIRGALKILKDLKTKIEYFKYLPFIPINFKK